MKRRRGQRFIPFLSLGSSGLAGKGRGGEGLKSKAEEGTEEVKTVVRE